MTQGLGVRGPRGWAFSDINITAAPGALIAVVGPSGTGRTCLLLALTGRMRITAGLAEVGEYRLPRQMTAVRRSTGLGPVPGVSDLEPALTVAEQLRERALLARRFGGSLRGLLRPRAERAADSRARIDNALSRAGLDLDTLPKGPRTAVRDLERLEALRLSVALALIGCPRLLAVDDADLKLSAADQARAWSMLRGIADGGTTVLAVCSEPPQGAVVVTTRRADRPREASGLNATSTTSAASTTSGPGELDGARKSSQTSKTRKTRQDRTAHEHEEGAPDAIAEAGRA
ncbi:ATP-binding cassette domain-containing protein [Streptomyces zagrosensis]|nr:ATP-binding cassette domain-containing protein [Streptomyces zagrosensis]